MDALAAAKLAQAVYGASPTIGAEYAAARASVYGDRQEIVAFPGTDNIACWLADLDALAVEVPGFGRIHAGFWQSWLEIRAGVLGLPGTEVLIGHSEGAALALLCAANLILVSRPPKQVFAFEPPQLTTDATLKNLFAIFGVEVHLYRNGNDVVPIVPRLLEDWQHPGTLVTIGRPRLPFPNIEDHAIANVIAALQPLGDLDHVAV